MEEPSFSNCSIKLLLENLLAIRLRKFIKSLNGLFHYLEARALASGRLNLPVWGPEARAPQPQTCPYLIRFNYVP